MWLPRILRNSGLARRKALLKVNNRHHNSGCKHATKLWQDHCQRIYALTKQAAHLLISSLSIFYQDMCTWKCQNRREMQVEKLSFISTQKDDMLKFLFALLDSFKQRFVNNHCLSVIVLEKAIHHDKLTHFITPSASILEMNDSPCFRRLH